MLIYVSLLPLRAEMLDMNGLIIPDIKSGLLRIPNGKRARCKL